MGCSAASADIDEQVGAIQHATTEAAGAIGEIGVTVKRTATIAGTMCDAVTAQHTTTADMNRSIREAAGHTREMSAGINSVAEAAHEAGIGADHTRTAAAELDRMAHLLRSGVEKFLVGIRKSGRSRTHEPPGA
jgi:methyl-accepting chemotaxis protein